MDGGKRTQVGDPVGIFHSRAVGAVGEESGRRGDEKGDPRGRNTGKKRKGEKEAGKRVWQSGEVSTRERTNAILVLMDETEETRLSNIGEKWREISDTCGAEEEQHPRRYRDVIIPHQRIVSRQPLRRMLE